MPNDGRADSIWDTYCRKGKCQGQIPTSAAGSGVQVRSIMFMKNYRSDINLLAKAGAKAFR
jgi:beta-glucosidase/6-phospho-beta-glucosidase/beta-galactosidase